MCETSSGDETDHRRNKRNCFFYQAPSAEVHSEAIEEAKAIVCEKSLTLFEDTFDKKPLPEPPCQTTVVDETMRLAEKLGILYIDHCGKKRIVYIIKSYLVCLCVHIISVTSKYNIFLHKIQCLPYYLQGPSFTILEEWK